MGKEVSTSPDRLDGGLTDGDLAHSHDARTISEAVRGSEDGGAAVDDKPEEQTNRAAQEECRHGDAVTRISDRGAQERKSSVGLSKKEAGGAQVGPSRFVDGLQWSGGKLADRRTIEDAAFRESVRRQNAFVKAERRLNRYIAAGAYADSFADRDSVAPEQGTPDFQQPKAATGFTVESKSRISKGQRAEGRLRLQKQIELDKISDAIRARTSDPATAKRDADIGALLQAARALLDRGKLNEWLASIPLARRTAFAILEKCKESSTGKSAG